jgi:site-specific recombinase XerD
LLHAFFHEWLVQQRNVSHHTVLSYRDSWRLFLRFVAAQKTKSVAKLGMDDLTAVEVLAFLKDVEQVRKSSIGTRNCRLSALHSFFRFVADREPLAAAQCAAVLGIPTKQAPVAEIRDLDEDEISAILAQPNRLKLEGQRDHVLLAVLYNTGARIQEALDLSPQALRLESPFQVRLFGKGRKERICPLWPETVELLKALLKRKPRREDEPIFVNRYGNPLKASGVRFKLKQYAAAAGKKVPSLLSKRVSPHRFSPDFSSYFAPELAVRSKRQITKGIGNGIGNEEAVEWKTVCVAPDQSVFSACFAKRANAVRDQRSILARTALSLRFCLVAAR